MYPTAQFLNIVDDINISYFDKAMINISTCYSTPKLEKKIITSFIVTSTDKRNHKITPEKVASKWGMGLKISQATIYSTMNNNVWSAVLPLLLCYHAVLLSHRLRCLDTRFCMETYVGA